MFYRWRKKSPKVFCRRLILHRGMDEIDTCIRDSIIARCGGTEKLSAYLYNSDLLAFAKCIDVSVLMAHLEVAAFCQDCLKI